MKSVCLAALSFPLIVFGALASGASASGISSGGKSLCVVDSCGWSNHMITSGADVLVFSQAKTITAPAKASNAAPTKSVKQTKQAMTGSQSSEEGNLPGYIIASQLTKTEKAISDGYILVADKISGALLHGLRSGDVLKAELEQSIKASPSVPTPIRARIISGTFRNATLLGSAVFDRELKRILITFERLRLPYNDTLYALKATGLALDGQVGFEGDYHSQEGTYFAGEILAATAAGYADATIQRAQNAIGNYQMEPSLSNSAKQGAVSALSKTAERFAERGRSAPEYTEIEGGREIQILVQESPTEVSGS